MYKCSVCGEITPAANLAEIKIPHYEVDTRIYETFYVCPVCESKSLEEVKLCPVCREVYISDNDDACAECALNEWEGI